MNLLLFWVAVVVAVVALRHLIIPTVVAWLFYRVWTIERRVVVAERRRMP